MLLNSLKESLEQIQTILDAIAQLPSDAANDIYAGKRVGSHVRHALDHFTALLQLSERDTVDYNVRSRESLTETNIDYASNQITTIKEQLEILALDSREVSCISEFDTKETKTLKFKSTVSREALWVLNHTIHHIALIKLLAEQGGLKLPEKLGVAPATASHQRVSA